jgi:hypothetical protein
MREDELREAGHALLADIGLPCYLSDDGTEKHHTLPCQKLMALLVANSRRPWPPEDPIPKHVRRLIDGIKKGVKE